ncbi:MAG: NADH-quinone oxidoreductase subunit L [Alphaproteobacteria bacterium]
MLFKISIYLAVFLPLAGFVISGILSRLASKKLAYFEDHHNPHHNFVDKFAQIFTTICLFGSLLFSIIIFYEVFQNKIATNQVLISWISSGDLIVNWSLKIDSLVAIMLIVVSGVSFVVHLYSIGYMHEDPSIARFMSYLSLFTFFMLMLVSADNFVQLFFGWEGVGVASYLLIGFWFKKQSANLASMKAFIANRVGDCGLILAIALIFLTFGSVDYATVFANLNNHLDDKFTLLGLEFATLETIAILLFIGAMGKSAQIGLHVWLADAMEGPTPVSALIHAATMVTAGVFLVIRCSPIFELAPMALNFVTIVGALTAFFSATIALTQNDIKKIIAYSTCSQLGYMFFACGVSAYQPAIFHLATHAFFKALLFLSAGSVIHAMHHEQDIRKMGGIYKKIPITYAMMWIGSLALAGFPPFAGFYSKDAILESAFMSHSPFGKLAFGLGIASAFLTAFYSWRLLFLTFHGQTRADHHTFEHAHESPKTMLIPLFVLSIGSIFAGFVGVKFLSMLSAENNFFSDAIFVSQERSDLLNEIHHSPALVKLAPMLVSIIAIALAYLFYIKQNTLPNQLAKTFKLAYKISFNKWYFDEIYDKIFVKPTRKIGDFSWRIIDVKIIDGIPNGLAHLSKLGSTAISKIQTGFIFNYALWMVLGLVGIIFYLVMSLKSLGVIVK